MIGDKEVIDFLIPTEGFLEHPTKIGDGKITLGSGLTDPKWRELYRKRGNKWSQEDNMMAVKEEVQKRRKWAEKNVPNWSSLPEASQDALLSYKYNYDFNSKNSPKLYKALKEKRFRDAAKQIDATSKDPAFREGLEKRRKKEQAWFLSGFPGRAQQSASTMPPYAPAPFNGLSVWEEIQKNTMPRKFAEGGYLEDTPEEYIDALYPEEYVGDIKTYKPWEELSMREKADMMRAAVRNGITTLPEIREKYNEFASGGNLYGGGGVKIGGANATWIYYGLVEAAAKDGINVSPGAGAKGQKNFRVTSNYRPNTPYITINGKPTKIESKHYRGNALDIVPGNGTSWDDILNALHNPNSHISQWMLANNLGYLDERKGQRGAAYGRGSNIHIGIDHNNAVRYRQMMTKAGAQIPASSTTPSYQTVAYTKSQPAQYTGNYLDIVKNSIKAHEGWRTRPYRDDGSRGNGWRSVGWGFNDSGFYSKYPKGISNHYANGITKAQAEEELNWFLSRAENDLRKSYGAKWDSFTDGQKAAILDTYYQQPASVTGKNSAFRNAILNGDPNAVNYLGVRGYDKLNTARRDMFNMTSSSTPSVKMPVGYTEESPFFFTPANPTVFFNPGAVQTVSREDFINQGPIVQQAVEEVYDPKKEARDNFEKFNMFMSFLNNSQPTQEESDFPQIVSSLTGSSSPYTVSAYGDGGSIRIKPSHRGRFTELKKRTGHSATWFKENGTPAQKKMATFALNSRHWKHGLGGNLFKKGGPKDSKKEDEARYEFDSAIYTHPSDTKGILAEQVVTPQGNYTLLNPKGGDAWSIGALEDMRVPLYRSAAIPQQPSEGITNQAANEKADEFANRTSLTPERFLGLMGANMPLAAGALGTVVAAPAVGNAIMESVVNPVSDYIGGTAAGQFITRTLANPYVDTGLKSAFAGHGLNHWINEGIDGWGDAAMTALEMAPLGELARPLWNAGRNSLGLLKDNAKAFYNNLTMDLNSVPGRFYHGSPSRTIEEFIPGDSGGIYFTPTKRAARGYTGSLGTGRVYEANLNLGDNPVVVDARGKAWNAIPEEEVAKAFGMPKEEIYEQIGHYNAGAEPWYSDFLKPFGYNPNTRSYAVDQIVTLGKDLGKSSLTIKGARDSGKGLFGRRQLPYDQIVVYSPEQVSLLKPAPYITAENAANITPEQWNAAFREAHKAGDKAEGQRLWDLWYKIKTPGNKAVDSDGKAVKSFHTVGDKYDPHFNSFDTNIEGFDSSVYTTDDTFMSGTYSKELISEAERNHIVEETRKHLVKQYEKVTGDIGKKLYDFYKNHPEQARKKILQDHGWLSGDVNPDRQKQLYTYLREPVEIDAGGHGWGDLPLSHLPDDVYKEIKPDMRLDALTAGYSTRSLEEAQKAAGHYDGAIVHNVVDYGGAKRYGSMSKPGTVYMVNDPRYVKSAEPFTYADDGSLIGLTDRADFSNTDIRYLKGTDINGVEHELPIRTMRGGIEDINGNIISDEELVANWKRSQDFYKMRLRSRGAKQQGKTYTTTKEKAYDIVKQKEGPLDKEDFLAELDDLGGAFAAVDGNDGYSIVTKELNTTGKQRRGTSNSGKVHEGAHLMRSEEEAENLEDIDWSNLSLDKDEAAARGTQLKSMLGIKDSTPITSKQLQYLIDNFVRLTGMDNNMHAFLNSITDVESAAKWLSRNAYSLGGALNLLGILKTKSGKRGL